MQAADPDSVSWLRFAFASITVIGLMALLGWGLKYFAMRGWLTPRGTAPLRLKIKASLPIDARRRLMIAQCDETEYHLLLGVNGDIVLSSHPAPPLNQIEPPSTP